MRSLLLLTLCLGLAACTANPQRLYEEQVVNGHTALAKTPAEALRNASAQPMPVAPGWRPPRWKIGAEEPRLLLDGVPSHYRVFSIELKADKPFLIKVDSWCVNRCFGFSKYVLAPHLTLLDEQANVLGQGFGEVRGNIGLIAQALTGSVPRDGTYYLIVAADNRSPGKPVLIDNVMVIGAGGMPAAMAPLRIGMGSYPFGSVAPYLAEPQ